MAFQVSPGINTSEIDLTTVIPSISTTEGAIGGVFSWGPVGKFILVDSENTLAARYGKPTNDNAETWFSAANFLSYGNRLYVSRAASSTTNNAVANSAPSIGYQIKNADHFQSVSVATGTEFVARYPGTLGNSLKVSVCETVDQYSKTINPKSNTSVGGTAANYNLALLKTATMSINVNSKTANVALEWDSTLPVAITAVNKSAGGTVPVEIVIADYAGITNVDATYTATVGTTTYTIVSSVTSNLNRVITLTGNPTVAVDASVIFNPPGGVLSYAETKTATTQILNSLTVGDYIQVGNSSIGTQYLKIKSLPVQIGFDTVDLAYFDITFEDSFKLSTNFVGNTIPRAWEYFNTVSSAPETSQSVTDAGSTVVDQLSVVVVDEDGKFSGTPGTVLEVFQNVSRAIDAKNIDGSTAFFKTVINDSSKYIWSTYDLPNATSAVSSSIVNSTATIPYTKSFITGTDGSTEANIPIGDLARAYDLFADTTSVDVSLIIAGLARGGSQVANYIIDNIAEKRKDCVVFVSPEKSDVFGAGVEGNQALNIKEFRGTLRNSSYAVMDSGYKYQYDKYNDVYRYIPLNGDIAGLTARTDDVRDPWFSPAGFSRGQIKNVVKLAYNPTLADRDVLYKNDVNPVVTFPGKGTVLFGDKTALGRQSAFDHINVRRLFIILEKTVSTAAQSTLFEFNDEFTRAQFKNLVEPFLRDVQGRRGIYDFRVVCDETNNTAEIVDSNRFVGDIYVKPAKSINFIQLNFVAVRSGVEFTEVVGQF